MKREEKNRQNARRRNPLGLLALGLALAVLALYLILGGRALVRLLQQRIAYTDIQTLLTGATAAIVVSALGLLAGLAALLLRGRRRLAAAFGLGLSALLLLVSCALCLGYHYTVGTLETNDAFRALPDAALDPVVPEPDGRIDRNTEAPESTMSPESIEEKTGQTEIERYLLVNEDIPEAALEAMRGTPPTGESYLLPGAEQIQNIVLYGLDAAGSSDCIIIVSLDHVHKKLKLISISRDTYAPMPDWGSYSRITYAYNWGGAQMALRTLNRSFSLNITDYITVELDALATIVDYLGGIVVDLDSDEIRSLGGAANLTVGRCRLTGTQAAAYARIRKSSYQDNEFRRTGRQREVLLAMLDEMLQMPYTEYPQLIRICLGLCETSMESGELLDLCMKAVLGGYAIDTQTLIPGDRIPYWGGRIGDQAFCVYDLNRASDEIYRLIYEELYISGYTD